MARIFGQLAAQPVDIYRMLDGDSKFTALATATLERPGTTDVSPALTYAEKRVNYSLGDITDGIEIVVLSDELRQDDVLLDTRTRRVRLVSILIGAFGSAWIWLAQRPRSVTHWLYGFQTIRRSSPLTIPFHTAIALALARTTQAPMVDSLEGAS